MTKNLKEEEKIRGGNEMVGGHSHYDYIREFVSQVRTGWWYCDTFWACSVNRGRGYTLSYSLLKFTTA